MSSLFEILQSKHADPAALPIAIADQNSSSCSLLRVGPLAPAYYPENKQRGTDSPHFYNNHIYSVGQHPSPVADRMLETACSLSYGADNWP